MDTKQLEEPDDSFPLLLLCYVEYIKTCFLKTDIHTFCDVSKQSSSTYMPSLTKIAVHTYTSNVTIKSRPCLFKVYLRRFSSCLLRQSGAQSWTDAELRPQSDCQREASSSRTSVVYYLSFLH